MSLVSAVHALAAACDGAREQDGQGFNGTDTMFGHRLAALPPELWTDGMRRAAWEMLAKYRAQLAAMGIAYDAIAEPPRVDTPEFDDARQDARRAVQTAHEPRDVLLNGDNRFLVRFPYNAKLTEEIRAIPGRRWHSETRVNTVPYSSARQLRAFARRHNLHIPDEIEGLLDVLCGEPEPAPPFDGIDFDGKQFIVRFPFSERMTESIKSRIPGRTWNRDLGAWIVPHDPTSAHALVKWAEQNTLASSDAAGERIRILTVEMKARLEASTAAHAELDMQGFGVEPYPFQRAGIVYGRRVRRVLIADDMGLGKTIQALGLLWIEQLYPAVIVVPASVKLNWLREAKRCLPGKRCMVADNATTAQQLAWADVIITNYDQLKIELDDPKKPRGKYHAVGLLARLIARDPRAVVFDEFHYCKNSGTIRAKACLLLAKGREWRVGLTGTPFTNRPAEGISQLRILGRLKDLGGQQQYTKRYCRGHHDGHRYNTSGHANLQELNARLRSVCMIRRLKKDVLKELPPKQRSIVPIEIANRREYNRAEADLIAWLKSQPLPKEIKDAKVAAALRAEHLVRISALKQLAAQGKIPAAKAWVKDFLEAGEKLIFFCWHREIVDALVREFKAPSITGDTPIPERQAAVDRFQTDESCRLIVCNIKAAGVGLTLTAASNVAFLELPWTPGDLMQAEDRAHRIGQTADSVNAWYLLGENTIDFDNYELIEDKQKVVSAAADGEEADMGASIAEAMAARLRARE